MKPPSSDIRLLASAAHLFGHVKAVPPRDRSHIFQAIRIAVAGATEHRR